MILESGLLFWTTLYTRHRTSVGENRTRDLRWSQVWRCYKTTVTAISPSAGIVRAFLHLSSKFQLLYLGVGGMLSLRILGVQGCSEVEHLPAEVAWVDARAGQAPLARYVIGFLVYRIRIYIDRSQFSFRKVCDIGRFYLIVNVPQKIHDFSMLYWEWTWKWNTCRTYILHQSNDSMSKPPPKWPELRRLEHD